MITHVDRIPTQVLANGAIRYEDFDSAGNSLGYRWTKRADAPTEAGTPQNKLLFDELLAASGTTAGTATALTLAQAGFSLADGAVIRFKLHTDIGANATLNVNGAGAKNLLNTLGVAVSGFLQDAYITAIYNGAEYVVQSQGRELSGSGNWTYLGVLNTAGSGNYTVPDALGDGSDFELGAFIIAAGGSGAATKMAATSTYNLVATGGASGRTKAITMTVSPGDTIPYVVGAKGTGVSIGPGDGNSQGSAGGSSAFNSISADGGEGGYGSNNTSDDGFRGVDGGQSPNSDAVDGGCSAAMGEIPAVAFNLYGAAAGGNMHPLEALNIFNNKKYLGAGGTASGRVSSSSQYAYPETATTLEDGNGGGAGAGHAGTTDATTIYGGDATGYGNGGGGAVIAVYGSNGSGIAYSGDGSDGAILLYFRRIAV